MDREPKVGFALHPDLDYLERAKPLFDEVDYLELAPETMWLPCESGPFVANDFAPEYLRILAGRPAVAHGVGMSLAEPGGAHSDRRKRWLDAMARDHQTFCFDWWTDHLGATMLGGLHLSLPVPVPNAAVERMRATLAAMATIVPEVGVENSAFFYSIEGQEAAQVRVTASKPYWLLLDLHNVLVSCEAQAIAVQDYLAQLDFTRVIEIHIAGGTFSDPSWLRSGKSYRLDGHDQQVPTSEWEMLAQVLPQCSNLRGIALERMEGTLQNASDVAQLHEELARIRHLIRHADPIRESTYVEYSELVCDAVFSNDELHSYAQCLARGDKPEASWLHSVGEDAFTLTTLLIAKLRFERTQRGHEILRHYFDENAQEYAEIFRRYHQEVPMTAYSPAEEAQRFLKHARQSGVIFRSNIK